jgi:1-aminocyclopropane-1-carboxylate deaminase
MMYDLSHQIALPSPIHQISHPILGKSDIILSIKRDDLIHPIIGGNKWRKLSLNLEAAIKQKAKAIITFGGAYSNHIHATAGACQMLGLPSVGIIRGEIDPHNPTMQYCQQVGMTLIPVNRSDYRQKQSSPIIINIIQQYDDPYLIPEGGSNTMGMLGVAKIWEEINQQMEDRPDIVVCPCGSGGTTAGLSVGAPSGVSILSIPVLKTDYLSAEVNKLIDNRPHVPIIYSLDYHYGGYAKYDADLIAIIKKLSQEINIPLDQVYTGKAMVGLFDMIKNQKIARGSHVLYVHTGGMQGAIDELKHQ